MTKPIVSFVVPVFNSENDVARCLLSIRNLQFPKDQYELLIMDNGSTDRTHHIMHYLGFAFAVVTQVNVSALRNRGAATAQGQYVAFIDSDVELSPHWLQGALKGFENPRVVACGCFPRAPKQATWVQQTWELHQRGRNRAVEPALVPWLPSMNLIVRRDDFFAVAGFNEELETAEDVDLCYRLEARGTILCNPAMEAVHWGEAQDLRTFWRKEVWRGMGNLKGVLSHGLRWDEVPSLGYPMSMISSMFFLAVAVFFDLWYQQLLLAPLCLALLTLPALLLAMNTGGLANSPRAIPRLFLLYLVYGLARAYSIVKAWTALLA
jgi:glycosyltransferase involved in cell wall biosynthesis